MVKRVFKWTSNILIIFLLIICTILLFSVFQVKNNPEQLPTMLGFKIMTILTGSMEPVLDPGDLIVVKSVDPMKVKVNDVITYKNSQNTMITHRIVDLNLREGEVFFETKGDANNVRDEGNVQSDQLVGSLLFSIPKAGYLVIFLKSPTGLAMLLAIPFLYLTIGVLKIIFNNKKEKDRDLTV